MMTAAAQWYGIEWDSTNPSPACTRIGRKEMHVALPIQSRMRRCVLRDDGSVAYYLHESDSTLREDGEKANLDGSDGMVMVEIPAHYRRFETVGTTYRCMLSEQPLAGFHHVPTAYRSAYEATVDRTDAALPKLASVVNTSAAFRGGNNNAAYDDTYRSFLGRPVAAINCPTFRRYARNRGRAGMNSAGWNCDLYELYKTCFWLFATEYANFRSRSAYVAELTDDGYRQGGLGLGVTTMNFSVWGELNGHYPFVPCGVTNSLGNHTGVVDFTQSDADGDVLAVGSVASYRGLENAFGHISTILDGSICNIQSDEDGGKSEFYVCRDPAKFGEDLSDYELRGELPRSSNFIKVMLFGEFGDTVPTVVGGSSVVYFTDYFYTDVGHSYKAVLMGSATASSGALAGMTYLNASLSASIGTSADVGTRLCFLP